MKNKEHELIEKLNKAAGSKIAVSGDSIDKVDIIPTGIIPLDFALGIGGIPRGRITDIYSLPSVGKSTLCYSLIANAQAKGLVCALVDAENAYAKEYVEHFGIDTSKLIVIAPNCLEEAGEAIETLVREKVGLIVIDSITSLIPRALAEADHGKPQMAYQARGISQMLLKLVQPVAKFNTAIVTINQMRVNIMAMHPGDKYAVTGGWALKFYSSIRIEMKRLQAITKKDEKDVIGYKVGFKIMKNKLARPGLTCEVPYLYGAGFTKEGNILEMALERGLVIRDGNKYFYGETNLGTGKEKASLAIEADSAIKGILTTALFPR